MPPEVIENDVLDYSPAFAHIRVLDRSSHSRIDETWNRPRTVVVLADHASVVVVESALQNLAKVTTHDIELLDDLHLPSFTALLPCTGVNLLCSANTTALVEMAKQIRQSIPTVIIIAVLAECSGKDVKSLLRTGINGCLFASQVAQDGLTEALIACSTSSSVVLSSHLCWLLAGDIIKGTAGNSEDGPIKLTPRQIEILHRLAEGLTGMQIAQDLGISEKTVQAHLMRAREKFGCSTTYQLCVYLTRMNVI
jgi:DNA-binding NarL/FixJ family response regulator